MRQACVIGLGQFGSHLARTLVKLNCEVLAVDTDEQRVGDIRDADFSKPVRKWSVRRSLAVWRSAELSMPPAMIP